MNKKQNRDIQKSTINTFKVVPMGEWAGGRLFLWKISSPDQ